MNKREERRLLSQHRHVPAILTSEYGGLWQELAGLVASAGNHAWRFVSGDDGERHLEFLEFESKRDPRDDPRVAALLARLDEVIGPARVEEWLEAR